MALEYDSESFRMGFCCQLVRRNNRASVLQVGGWTQGWQPRSVKKIIVARSKKVKTRWYNSRQIWQNLLRKAMAQKGLFWQLGWWWWSSVRLHSQWVYHYRNHLTEDIYWLTNMSYVTFVCKHWYPNEYIFDHQESFTTSFGFLTMATVGEESKIKIMRRNINNYVMLRDAAALDCIRPQVQSAQQHWFYLILWQLRAGYHEVSRWHDDTLAAAYHYTGKWQAYYFTHRDLWSAISIYRQTCFQQGYFPWRTVWNKIMWTETFKQAVFCWTCVLPFCFNCN
jgi:hypothetical protein